ncbi:DUF5590 domain-containing protein [Ligilactobacillus sp. WILCCON 0076]|uniref:DUF5590 domain-containing protein n=1 Tax=Ligilactobacillus ubinensis TaxID=2876789 RepID=A0A9X2FLZ7_9LACO|nr:DUF5590 domain-containing protein [Ligilactobacillus ubinensis]MCP0887710.1 DUF5590 domain-containing protein [Ligilactobacillus ubinensis]
MRRTKKARFSWKQLIIVLCIILVGYGCWYSYHKAQEPLVAAKKEAYTLADKYANLKTHTAFYWYNREKTYYTVAGKNNKNEAVYVIVSKKGDKINIYSQSKGITAKKAKQYVQSNEKPKKILKVALGMKTKKQPVWEITYLNKKGELCYDLISFKSGKVIKSIQNI